MHSGGLTLTGEETQPSREGNNRPCVVALALLESTYSVCPSGGGQRSACCGHTPWAGVTKVAYRASGTTFSRPDPSSERQQNV